MKALRIFLAGSKALALAAPMALAACTSASADPGSLDCRGEIFLSRQEFEELAAVEDFVIVLQVLGDCPLERQVILRGRPEWGEVKAEVLQPVGDSIAEQEERLQRQVDSLAPDEACERIKVSRREVSSSTNASLAELVEDLEHLQVPATFEPVMFIHGVHYQIWTAALVNTSTYKFYGPPYRRSARDTEALHPLDTWTQKLLSVLQASCPVADV